MCHPPLLSWTSPHYPIKLKLKKQTNHYSLKQSYQILLKEERQNDVNTPFLRAWTKILPSTESAKRIPSGFSRVTMYSFKFILKDEPFDIAKILTVRSFSLRLVSIVDRPLILMKHVSVPQKEEEPPPSNGGDERARALQLGSCRMNIFFFFSSEAPRLNWRVWNWVELGLDC